MLKSSTIFFSFSLLIQFYLGTPAYIITYLPKLLLSLFALAFGFLILETIKLFKKGFLPKCNQRAKALTVGPKNSIHETERSFKTDTLHVSYF